MPLVRITTRSGRGSEYRKALLDGVHSALVDAFKIPDRDRTQVLHELDADRLEVPPEKSDRMTIIEITAFKGRTADAKKALYERIVRNLGANPGIPGDDIMIIIHDVPLENWGIRGGKPASEISLGFKVDV